MMYKWLPVEESDNVPNFAHTTIGVGAVVENDGNQILVVKEKYFYKKPLWKLPGGYVEPGRNIRYLFLFAMLVLSLCMHVCVCLFSLYTVNPKP